MNRITSTLLLFISLALLVFTVVGKTGFTHLQQLDKQIQLLEKNNRQLGSEILNVDNEIFGIRHSNDILEKKSREDLGLSRPGEIVYMLSRSSMTAGPNETR